MKEIRISDEEQTQKNIYREIKASISLSCNPYMVKTYNIYSHPGSILHILLEFCKYGSSQDMLKKLKTGKLTENALAVFIIDTLRGLAYLHDNCKIIHRDIKSANILIDEHGYCKLADFGVASSVLPNDDEAAMKTFVGSLSYMSPERIQNQPYSYVSDVWSMGLTYVELLTGSYPYDNVNSFWDAMNVIVNGAPSVEGGCWVQPGALRPCQRHARERPLKAHDCRTAPQVALLQEVPCQGGGPEEALR